MCIGEVFPQAVGAGYMASAGLEIEKHDFLFHDGCGTSLSDPQQDYFGRRYKVYGTGGTNRPELTEN
jgi:hypothetical protein